MKIIKKTLSLVILVCFFTCLIDTQTLADSLTVQNDSNQKIEHAGITGEEGNFKYYISKDGNDVKITGYNNIDDSTDITIPETIAGKKVTSIGEEAFRDCTSLVSINIPEGVTSIDGGQYGGAFQGCSNLKLVNIPEGVTSIGEDAFKDCTSLISIKIPQEVTSIGSGAFEGCSNLTSINIPEGVTLISAATFYGCSNLTSIHIPEGVNGIGWKAFLGCSSLESIHIPEKVPYICDSTFEGCSSLKSINIPEGVKGIDARAFQGCSSLESINIPEKVTCINDYAFSGCSSLKSINIPEGVTSIGKDAFDGCSSLKSINIPEGVTSIGNHAFARCSSLKLINIPEGVTSIDWGAFSGCSSLESIHIPEGVTSICNYTFEGCSSLESIHISEGATLIDHNAFEGCSSLKSINIPEGVTSIGNGAFEECSSLESINIPKGVTSIGYYAFEGCSNLKSIDIPEGVTLIDNCTFSGCRSLESIDIPKGVTSIGDGAFEKCSNLKSIKILEGVTSISGNALDRCSKDLIIYGYKNTEAEKYANEHNIKFVALNQQQENNSDNNNSGNNNSGNKDSNINIPNSLPSIEFPDIPKSVPIMECTDFSLNGGIFRAQQCMTEDNHEKIIFGVGKKAYEMQIGDLSFSDIDKCFNEIVGEKENASKLNSDKGIEKEKGMLEPEFDYSILGYYELAPDSSGNFTIPVKAGLIGTVDGSLSKLTYVWDIPPVFIGLEVGLEGSVGGDVEFDYTNSFLLKKLTLIMQAKIETELSLELGLEGIAAAGLYGGVSGELTASNDFYLQDKTSEGNGAISVDMDLGIKANLLWFSYKGQFVKCNLSYDSSEGDDWKVTTEFPLADGVNGLLNKVGLGTDDNKPPMSSGYINADNYSLVSSGSQDTNANDDIKFSIVDGVPGLSTSSFVDLDDGKKLAVWIEDDNTRSDMNKKRLMYSIFDGTKWSESKAVCDDATPDFKPHLVKSKNGSIYLVWEKSSESFKDDATLKYVADRMQVYAAKFDGSKFSDITNLTKDDNVANLAIRTTPTDSGILVSWINNSDNNLFGLSDDNSIKYLWFDGQASDVSTALGKLSAVVDYDIIADDHNNINILYSCDEDNNLNTENDRNIYLYNGEIEKIISASSDTYPSNPRLIDYNGRRIAFWYNNHKINFAYLDDLNKIYTINNYMDVSNFDVVTNGQKIMILYKKSNSSNDESKKFASNYYGILCDGDMNNWTAPILLNSNNDRINYQAIASMDKYGNVDLMYNSANTKYKEDYTDNQVSLCFETIKNDSKIDIDKVSVDTASIDDLKNLVINISCKNNGTKSINNYSVQLVDEDNKVISSVDKLEELLPGNDLDSEIKYTLPDECSSRNLKVNIISDGKVLATKEIAVKVNDISIQNTKIIKENNQYYVSALLKNNTNNNVNNVNVELLDGIENNGIVLNAQGGEQLKGNESKEVKIPIDSSQVVVDNVLTIDCSMDEHENNYINNGKSIIVKSSDIIPDSESTGTPLDNNEDNKQSEQNQPSTDSNEDNKQPEQNQPSTDSNENNKQPEQNQQSDESTTQSDGEKNNQSSQSNNQTANEEKDQKQDTGDMRTVGIVSTTLAGLMVMIIKKKRLKD